MAVSPRRSATRSGGTPSCASPRSATSYRRWAGAGSSGRDRLQRDLGNGGPRHGPPTPPTLGAPRQSRGAPRYSERLLEACAPGGQSTLRTRPVTARGQVAKNTTAAATSSTPFTRPRVIRFQWARGKPGGRSTAPGGVAHESSGRPGVGEVGAESEGARARGLELADRPARRTRRAVVADRHVHAGPRQGERDRPSDAHRASRDERPRAMWCYPQVRHVVPREELVQGPLHRGLLLHGPRLPHRMASLDLLEPHRRRVLPDV